MTPSLPLACQRSLWILPYGILYTSIFSLKDPLKGPNVSGAVLGLNKSMATSATSAKDKRISFNVTLLVILRQQFFKTPVPMGWGL